MTRDIVIIDYGMGNLRSVQKALEAVGAAARVTQDAAEMTGASAMVLPGVGAFRKAMDRIRELGLEKTILDHVASGRPFLGICLGMHLLFSEGEEFGRHRGLDVIAGRVVRFAPGKKIPHMGWNSLAVRKREGILRNVADGTYVYFVHSFFPRPEDPEWVGATTDYGEVFPSVVMKNNVAATQFHPEKSQLAGRRILENFVAAVRGDAA